MFVQEVLLEMELHEIATAMGKLELFGKEETMVAANEVVLQVTDIYHKQNQSMLSKI